MRSRHQKAGDEGQATLLLITSLAIVLLALTVLFFRLGDANNMRTQAQTAADAAALAAVGEMKDRAARSILASGYPSARYDPTGTRARAENYARDNDAVLEGIRASDNGFGGSGHIVRVEVRGAQCQRELEEDRSRHWAEQVCDGTEEDEEIPVHVGNAAAIAQVELPSCYRNYDDAGNPTGPPICDDIPVYNLVQARSTISAHLVDEEGRYLFSATGGAGGPRGPVDPGSNRAIAQEMLGDYGWDNEAEWNCLDNLWENESNWDHTAVNPSSGAYGIPQVLPSAHPGVITPEFRNSPTLQIEWGLDYIQGRDDYGSPCAAWAAWQSRSPHWY